MKKSSTLIFAFLMVIIMSISLVSCGKANEESGTVSGESKAVSGESKAAESKSSVSLVQKKLNGIGFKIPSDFGDFEEVKGGISAADKASTASVFIADKVNAMGKMATDITKEDYTKTYISGYSDVKIDEFKNDLRLTHANAVYVHFTAKNSGGKEVEVYSYLILVPTDDGDDNFQNVLFILNKDADSSLKASIDEVKKSVDFNYDYFE